MSDLMVVAIANGSCNILIVLLYLGLHFKQVNCDILPSHEYIAAFSFTQQDNTMQYSDLAKRG